MQNMGTPEEKKTAIEWLKRVADDKNDPNSEHAQLLVRLLNFYIKTAGEVI